MATPASTASNVAEREEHAAKPAHKRRASFAEDSLQHHKPSVEELPFPQRKRQQMELRYIDVKPDAGPRLPPRHGLGMKPPSLSDVTRPTTASGSAVPKPPYSALVPLHQPSAAQGLPGQDGTTELVEQAIETTAAGMGCGSSPAPLQQPLQTQDAPASLDTQLETQEVPEKAALPSAALNAPQAGALLPASHGEDDDDEDDDEDVEEDDEYAEAQAGGDDGGQQPQWPAPSSWCEVLERVVGKANIHPALHPVLSGGPGPRAGATSGEMYFSNAGWLKRDDAYLDTLRDDLRAADMADAVPWTSDWEGFQHSTRRPHYGVLHEGYIVTAKRAVAYVRKMRNCYYGLMSEASDWLTFTTSVLAETEEGGGSAQNGAAKTEGQGGHTQDATAKRRRRSDGAGPSKSNTALLGALAVTEKDKPKAGEMVLYESPNPPYWGAGVMCSPVEQTSGHGLIDLWTLRRSKESEKMHPAEAKWERVWVGQPGGASEFTVIPKDTFIAWTGRLTAGKVRGPEVEGCMLAFALLESRGQARV